MAEERLIDADKDKKYRIKINADGEEELVVDEGVEPVEEVVQEVLFEVEEISEDNEEEAVMTPEQLAAKRARLFRFFINHIHAVRGNFTVHTPFELPAVVQQPPKIGEPPAASQNAFGVAYQPLHFQ